MRVKPEITYRNFEKKEEIDSLIRKKISKLERICDYISSCHVVVEAPHQHQQSGNPIQVRIDVKIPPSHELVAKRASTEGTREEPLPTALRKGFEAMERQIKELVERQRGEVKVHPQQQTMAMVDKLFPEGYGFLKTVNGREIYFHRNSVLHGGFDRLEIGTGVRFVEEQGENGLQASTVEIMDKPGSRIPNE